VATLTVEGVPPSLLSRLACAAVANGRSVNSEVILSLVRHLREDSVPDGPGRRVPVGCPLALRLRPEPSRACAVPWGEPG